MYSGIGIVAFVIFFLSRWYSAGNRHPFKFAQHAVTADIPWSALSRVTCVIGYVCILVLCTITSVMVWSDSSGSGDIFTLQGVLQLFGSKSSQWIIGIWTEILAYQACVCALVMQEAFIGRLPAGYAVPLMFLALFVPSIALGMHVVGSALLLCARKRFEKQQHGDPKQNGLMSDD